MPADLNHSTLTTAGDGAARIAELFYWMLAGATIILVVVIALSVYAIASKRAHHERTTKRLVIGGGAILPTIVLSSLMAYGLSIMPELHRPAPEGSLTIRVTGVRWWWRVEYLDIGGEPFETANEIHLPVDQPVRFELVADDVIHSFWIPSLGGKMDMIPGRTNYLTLHPNRTGTYVGSCAEYCGRAHANMQFRVIVSEPDEFQTWMAGQRRQAPQGDSAGLRVFLSSGCSACHAIRGTDADGPVGPDLTHFASRQTIGAGILENHPNHLERWILQTYQVKPGVEMPAFESFANRPRQLRQLIDFMGTLQ